MKKHFEFIYWGIMTVILSLILTSVMGSFEHGLFLSLMLLPGILFVKYFSKDLPQKGYRFRILNWIYFIAAAMLIEYLGIILTYGFLYDFGQHLPEKTGILFNPFFIWFILGGLLAFEKLLKIKYFSSLPEDKYITFTSDRVKMSIEIDSIVYIESNDDQVFVTALSNKVYPTRMKISQWESVLDSRFIRVHRSFIVNRKHITRFDSKAVYIGDFPIDISRKYREQALNELENK